MSPAFTTASRWLLAVVVVIGAIMALRPLAVGVGPENWFPGADKLFHLGFCALLWCLAVRARITSAGWLGLGLLLFGIGLELAQGAFTASRSASVADVLADGAGLLLGAAITRLGLHGQPKEDRR